MSEPGIENLGTTLDWPRVMVTAASVSRRVASEYPGVEASDIEQELFLAAAAGDWVVLYSDISDYRLVGLMKGIARAYAARERAAYIYGSGQYLYRPADVRRLLDDAVFDADWDSPQDKERGIQVTAGGVWVALWDIRQAFDAMAQSEQADILARYRDKQDYVDDAARKRTNRAVDKLTRIMNGPVHAPPDGPGTRSVVSNAQAIYELGETY